MTYSTTNRSGYKEYKSCGEHCAECQCLSKCTESKDHVKLITRHVWEEYMEVAEDIRHTIGNRQIYQLRKETIERIFGTAKEQHGFRYTQYVGKARMEMKAGLTFACMNLKKLARFLGKNGLLNGQKRRFLRNFWIQFNFKGKNILFMILLSTMMIPWDVTMIPQYMEFNLFGWINTLKPLIVPAWFGSAYYVFLMRQFLMGIPKDFEEAARIDGANQFQIYWKIFMPIMKPSLILVGVLNMLTVWNDYLGPLIFLQDRSKYTLALGLASFKGVHSTQIIPMLCITIIMIIPPIIIFIIAQKYIVEGTSGSIK